MGNSLTGFLVTILSCGAAMSCTERPSAPLVVRPIFGPAIGNEVIAGRAEELDGRGPIVLLVGQRVLVAIDVVARTVTRQPLQLGDGSSCWGLARLRDGSLWTLRGRHAVAQILETGSVERELTLAQPYFGLFGEGDRLLYQPADFMPPAPALLAGAPGDRERVVWSSLRTRSFGLARALVAALNLVSCGTGTHAERPCWFPEEPALHLVDETGNTRRIELSGLDAVAPEVLLTSDNPARPVRDAYVDREGTIWVLGTGTPPSPAPEVPGGWVLARYGSRGEPMGVRRLSEPARLILRAGSGRALLLTGNGMVAEVLP
jgi:hypothetical protein